MLTVLSLGISGNFAGVQERAVHQGGDVKNTSAKVKAALQGTDPFSFSGTYPDQDSGIVR